MTKPEEFGSTLTWSVVVIGSIFISVGAIGYTALGEQVNTVIFLNIQPSNLLTSLQFLYAVAIMLSFPLCVYPAIRITEDGLFGAGFAATRSSTYMKWVKNVYRAVLVSFLGAVAFFERNDLDKFVSLVGCLACIPLSFIYPAMFHYKIAEGRWAKMSDLIVIVFGMLALGYTSFITIKQWGLGEQEPPRQCIPTRQ